MTPEDSATVDAFFSIDGDSYVPGPMARGPWGAVMGGQIIGGLLSWGIERCGIDPRLQPARLTVDLLRPVPGDIYKHDLEKDTVEVHSLGKGRGSGETDFVPREHPVSEDDGWLMSYVYDATTDGRSSSSSTPSTSPPVRSPESSCRSGFRSDSTETGSATTR